MQIDPVKLPEPEIRIKIRREFRLTWRFVLSWAAAVSVLGYACFSLLLFGMTPTDEIQIGLADCFLYPLRRAEIRQRQGAYLIEKGQIDARRGRYNTALPLLGAGLAKNPYDWATRLYFARLLYSVDARDSMRRLLEDGLAVSGQEPRYIDGVLLIAAASHENGLYLKTCEVGLQAARQSEDRRERTLVLSERKAAGLLSAGRTKEALEIIPRLASGEGENRVMLRAEALLRLELPATAAEELTAWLGAHEGNAALEALLARASRQAGNLPGMEAVLARSLAAHPDDSEVLIDLISNRALAGNTDGARSALQRYFVKFYGNPDNLVPLARAMSKIGDVNLLDACIAEADGIGYAGIGLREIMVEFLAARGEWDRADALLEEIARRRTVFAAPAGRWQEFYTALVSAARQPDTVSQVCFLELMRQERPQPDAYERVITQLARAGRDSTASALASLAQNRYPELRDWPSLARKHAAVIGKHEFMPAGNSTGA
jgi:predicted Zn-dependent protease